MNYNHLFYFHVTAQEGSIVRAARRLNVSQPTISEQLKQLEDYFGVKLFDRHGGALKLNNNGRRALEFTDRIFTTGDRLRQAFDEAPMPAKVRVEVGMISSAAHSVATDRLVGLFRDSKAVARIRHGDNHYLLHELVSSGLDILITDTLPHQAEEKGVRYKKISSTELIFIASNNLAKVYDDNLVEFLHRRPFIHYTEQSSYRWEIDRFLRESAIEPDITAEADDAYLILNAVAADIGIGVVPRSILADSGKTSEVQVLAVLNEVPNLYALYHEVEATEQTLRALDILTGHQEHVTETAAQ